MTVTGLAFEEDRARESDDLAHLTRCDARFAPPLSSRVDLPAYAHRLHQRARRFEAWADGALVGMVAAYFDDEDGTAFISNVSVDKGFLGCGIASTLLTQAVARADTAGLTLVRLRVGATNSAARRLYEKCGFRTCLDDGEQVVMQLNLSRAIQ